MEAPAGARLTPTQDRLRHLRSALEVRRPVLGGGEEIDLRDHLNMERPATAQNKWPRTLERSRVHVAAIGLTP